MEIQLFFTSLILYDGMKGGSSLKLCIDALLGLSIVDTLYRVRAAGVRSGWILAGTLVSLLLLIFHL